MSLILFNKRILPQIFIKECFHALFHHSVFLNQQATMNQVMIFVVLAVAVVVCEYEPFNLFSVKPSAYTFGIFEQHKHTDLGRNKESPVSGHRSASKSVQ